MDIWLNDAISLGLAKLLLLRLDGSPPDDVIDGTADAWLEALTHGMTWDEQRDRSRIDHAFRTLAQTRKAWPSPSHLLDSLPPPDAARLKFQPTIVPKSVATARINQLRGMLREGKMAAAGDRE